MSDKEKKLENLSAPPLVEFEDYRKSLPYIIGYIESSLKTIKELASTDQHTKVYQKVDEAIKFLKENFPSKEIDIDIKVEGCDERE